MSRIFKLRLYQEFQCSYSLGSFALLATGNPQTFIKQGNFRIGVTRYLVNNSNLFFLRQRVKFLADYDIKLYPIGPVDPSLNFQKPMSDQEALGDFNMHVTSTKQSPAGPFKSVMDIHQAYLDGRITPVDLAKNVIKNIDAHAGSGRFNAFVHVDKDLIIKQAQESWERYKSGKHLSCLDGVPVAIKDQVDVKGFETNHGTSYWNKGKVSAEDDFAVKRLRLMGAMIIGKTSMHELGFDVTNINPMTGVCRNPYNLNHVPGGSSGGSAAAVALGICPLALGVDGGGSIRIPSAFCGLYGLKPTYGRVSSRLGSVAHIGPIATSAHDMAIGYFAMAGADINDYHTLLQPQMLVKELGLFEDFSKIKVGIYQPFFEHCDELIHDRCYEILKMIKCRQEAIDIPHLEEIRVGHAAVITGEITAGIQDINDVSIPAQINCLAVSVLSPTDYILGCKVRSYAMKQLERIFEQVDVIATPTTACLPPSIPMDAHSFGSSNLTQSSAAMRFMFLGNLTGIPAVTVPVGYSADGLPIGIQFMSKWWTEELLIRIAYTIEKIVHRKTPEIYVNILEKSK